MNYRNKALIVCRPLNKMYKISVLFSSVICEPCVEEHQHDRRRQLWIVQKWETGRSVSGAHDAHPSLCRSRLAAFLDASAPSPGDAGPAA